MGSKNSKKVTFDFSAQFGPECITWEPNERTCETHGPIKFKREDFGTCLECNDKWRNVVFPKKRKFNENCQLPG
jgi:hypothetical protein